MSKYEELKRLAEASLIPLIDETDWLVPEALKRHGLSKRDAAYVLAANPATVLELISNYESVMEGWRLNVQALNEDIERAIRLTLEKAAQACVEEKWFQGGREPCCVNNSPWDCEKSIRSISVDEILKELGTSDQSIATSSGNAGDGGKSEQGVSLTELNASRYEIVRKMTPNQFAAAYELNIKTGKPFDEIIDDLAPFYYAAIAQEGKHE